MFSVSCAQRCMDSIYYIVHVDGVRCADCAVRTAEFHMPISTMKHALSSRRFHVIPCKLPAQLKRMSFIQNSQEPDAVTIEL